MRRSPLLIPLAEGEANGLEGAWPERVARRITRPELYAYLCATPARGRALVYAGGGYLQLMHDKEGVEVAQWLNGLGLDAYVLLHRLPGQDDGEAGPGARTSAGRPDRDVHGLRLVVGDHLAGDPVAEVEALPGGQRGRRRRGRRARRGGGTQRGVVDRSRPQELREPEPTRGEGADRRCGADGHGNPPATPDA